MRIGRLISQGGGVPRAAHGFGEYIGVEEIPLSAPSIGPLDSTMVSDMLVGTELRKHPLNHDLYLIDDPTLLYAAPLIKHNSDAAVVFYLCDNRPFGFSSYTFEDDSLQRTLIRKVNLGMEIFALRSLIRRYTDGLLAMGDLAADCLEEITGDDSIPVSPGYVLPDIADDLESITPNITSNSVVTVARGIDAKGVDMLVDAWPKVRDQFPDATLDIVGPNHPEEYSDRPGVSLHGFVPHEEIPGYLSDASLFINPARLDVFPMAPLEAMMGGVPTMVTSRTGVYGSVSTVGDWLVREPTPNDIYNGIVRYFELSEPDRERISERARTEGSKYRAEIQKPTFEENFYSVASKI